MHGMYSNNLYETFNSNYRFYSLVSVLNLFMHRPRYEVGREVSQAI